MDEPKPPWVTASQVGQAAYCPYQLYLALSGAERAPEAEAALARGDDAHETWNRADGPRPLRALGWLLLAAVLAVGALWLVAG